MYANVKKACRTAVAAGNRAVVVELEACAAEPVVVGGTCQAFSLDFEAHDEKLRIDDPAETPPRLRRLGQRCCDVS